ncbi:Zona pellucida sperm-binding protein 3 receptor [Cricetulus griseus]|uniref:Zona pellucida sperm-binding protein 3 receptor n=1 Tax=Cricetulus griseus TaxID=10029 RepID=G3GZR6_CRIGR|nr:Zona pellucida sperm-binding protein 3 receptor [Cricetulus griseus]
MTLATVLMAPVLGDCGPPPSLPFASPINQLFETTFSSGTVLKYTCHHGFKKVNSSHLTCDENGSWVYNVFCAIVTCESPPDISNGRHSGRDEDLYTYGSSVTYSCDPSFTLLGNASIVCTVVNKTVGVWSPSPPACENGCIDLPDIPYAFWEGNKIPLRNFEVFEIGTKLKYQCKPGYRPASNEPQIVRCQENLTWSPSKGCEIETVFTLLVLLTMFEVGKLISQPRSQMEGFASGFVMS